MFDKNKTILLLDEIKNQIEGCPHMAVIYEIELEYMLDRISQDDGFIGNNTEDPREGTDAKS